MSANPFDSLGFLPPRPRPLSHDEWRMRIIDQTLAEVRERTMLAAARRSVAAEEAAQAVEMQDALAVLELDGAALAAALGLEQTQPEPSDDQ
jgi:hypothetical protein